MKFLFKKNYFVNIYKWTNNESDFKPKNTNKPSLIYNGIKREKKITRVSKEGDMIPYYSIKWSVVCLFIYFDLNIK